MEGNRTAETAIILFLELHPEYSRGKKSPVLGAVNNTQAWEAPVNFIAR